MNRFKLLRELSDFMRKNGIREISARKDEVMFTFDNGENLGFEMSTIRADFLDVASEALKHESDD